MGEVEIVAGPTRVVCGEIRASSLHMYSHSLAQYNSLQAAEIARSGGGRGGCATARKKENHQSALASLTK